MSALGARDPARFTSEMYEEQVAGKPRLAGALSALEGLGVANAGRQAAVYAKRKQTRIEELIRAGDFAAFPDALRFLQAVAALG